MLKKRMILCLLMDNDGLFYNSRNFQIQPIGGIDWILNYLNFDAIDELVLLNVDRRDKDINSFSKHMRDLAQYCFVPISAGGGVSSHEDFHILLDNGADKIVINSYALKQPSFINDAAKRFGTQCIVASVDIKFHKPRNAQYVVTKNGTEMTNHTAVNWLRELQDLGAGEIFLTSYDMDGMGMGYDISLLHEACAQIQIPIIASGGVGELHHLADGMETGVSAVSAANIFHYVGDGLTRAKQYLNTQSKEFSTFPFTIPN